jgi:hypothetical protein
VAAMPRISINWQHILFTPLAEGVGKVSRSTVVAATFWLALVKVGYCAPLMVDGDGDVPSPSLSVSEVNNYGLLYLEQRLVVV